MDGRVEGVTPRLQQLWVKYCLSLSPFLCRLEWLVFQLARKTQLYFNYLTASEPTFFSDLITGRLLGCNASPSKLCIYLVMALQFYSPSP